VSFYLCSKPGKVNYSYKGVVTRECVRSMLIFNQFENEEASHDSFFSKDLKLQSVQSCYFKKYGKVSEIGCGTNPPVVYSALFHEW